MQKKSKHIDSKTKRVVREKYGLSNDPMYTGIVAFFGATRCPLDGAVSNILHKNVEQSLINDAQSVANDMRRAFDKERTFVDVEE